MEISKKWLKHKKVLQAVLFSLLLVVLTIKELGFYMRPSYEFFLVVLVLPFVIRKQSKEQSVRYGIIALVIMLVFFFIRLSSLYFFALVCSLFFLYESRFGKLNSLPLLMIAIVSPVAMSLSSIVGFEIRLWLTEQAVSILQVFNKGYSTSGNIILMGGNEFHVDSECMGLKMTLLSLFVSLLMMTYQQKKKGVSHSILLILLILLIALLLMVISNLMRIILITLFKSMPGTWSHDLIGIISFIVYVTIPLWFIIKAIPGRKTIVVADEHPNSIRDTVYYAFVIVITGFFLFFNINGLGKEEKTKPDSGIVNLQSEAYERSLEEHNVIKMFDGEHLVYIKPAVKFYSADHSPIICWKGSGYEIHREQIIRIGSKEVYLSELRKGDDLLYSAWWYDCGIEKTISQFSWRAKSLIYNNEYHLVNIIGEDKASLIEEADRLLSINIFGN